VQLRCAKSVDLGVKQLIVSDENMMGTMRANLRVGELYGGVGERIARFAEAFQGHLTDIFLNIRSPEYYWASVFGLFAEHGRGTPHPGLLRRVAHTPRSWRDVVTDVSCAAGGARVHVLPFERFAGRPDAQLAHLIGRPAPGHAAQDKRNTTLPLEQLRRVMSPSEGSLPEGEGRWMPFDDEQRAMLRETYADDLMWLESGAEGLAVLAEYPAHNKAEKHLPSPDKTRGRHHGRHAKVARAG
jgi:hypothetical protein